MKTTAADNAETLLGSRLTSDIISIAKKNDIKKVILFGSRARGDNYERSDIDLAVSGGSRLDFYYDLEEQAWTLLTFDVIDLDGYISEELKKDIQNDGVVLYEQEI